tara:strand:- start:38 stop:748 length:711 start_codon:yes stop_codon:yes gene_type:complete
LKGSKNINSINNLLNNSNLIFRLIKPIFIFCFFSLVFSVGCTSLKKKEIVNICSYASLPCLPSTEYVLLVTSKGNIKLELYGKSAPVTVGSFIDFVEKGSYDKTIFNRVISDPYPFIIRGGDNLLIKGKNKFIDSQTEKIRYIPLEIKLKNNKFPIYGKEIDSANQKNDIELKHKRAYISMSRSRGVNSASSQFFISLKSLPELDGRFAVFGKVVSGMNVVDSIQEKDFIVKALRL